MNILVLVGSIRENGNTYALAKEFKRGAEKNNNVEMIGVKDLNINPCMGCNCCFKNENNKCAINDDMNIIYEKMKNIDVLVIASPLYFYGISAKLKAIIDRFHNPIRNSFNLKGIALICCGAAKLSNMFDSVVMQYDLTKSFFNLTDYGMVLANELKDAGDALNSDYLKEAYSLGESIEE